jgi:5-hydroxyisourate hydrolase
MPGISIHVVDVSRGVLATGMQVKLYAIGADQRRNLIAKGRIGANGLLDQPGLANTFAAGSYLARFHVADYYRAEGVTLPGLPFLEIVDFQFGVADPAQHYHLPFKCTPWGYSCFRGGA